MTIKEKLFLEAKAWAEEKISLDKEYFERLASMHSPSMLWIGSSDSLIPVAEVTNTEPGEILVYRNLGSQVRHDDIGMMAMIQDAVEVVNVRHIVVCGYSHCSGIRSVVNRKSDRPHLRDWLRDVSHLYELHQAELELLDSRHRERRLCELNIEQQVRNLSKIECIQRAREKRRYPVLYGWYFDLYNGTLCEVCSHGENQEHKTLTSVVGTPAAA